MARILLATSPSSFCLLRSALTDHEILEATTYTAAQRLCAQNGIDLFMICLMFDESRSLELVNLIRLDARYKQTPIVVVRLTTTTIDFITQIMHSMKKLHVISDYLELEDSLQSELKIRDIVRELTFVEKKIKQ
ncbi:MAG: hypothetical protein P4L53_26250 [Candidatus Obscuribacterales bacterium]|nr:hypothetical protein [Candidatus Obscuribacterales bacterium]